MRKEEKSKLIRKGRRTARIRRKILGNSDRARLSVFRSNNFIYAQIIDDVKGKTLASASEKEVKGDKMTRVQKAEEVGKLIAQKAKEGKVKKVVFDKGSYSYHGRVKALAESARKEGLEF